MSEPVRLLTLVLRGSVGTAPVYSAMLSEAGFKVREAETRADLLAQLGHCPRLVMLVVERPDHDVAALCRAIKDAPGTRNTPIVCVCASAGQSTIAAGSEYPDADVCLRHPVDPHLFTLIVRALSQGAPAAVTPSGPELGPHGLFARLPLPMWIVDIDAGRFLAVNDAAISQFGYSRDEFLAMDANDLRPEPDAPTLREVFGNGGTMQEERRGTWALRKKDGSLAEVELLSVAVEFKGGWVALVVGRDITKQRQTEQALRKVSMAVEQSPASVVVTDVQGRIEYVNPKFTELTGYTPDEVLGQNPRILKSGEMPVEEYRKLWSTITAGGVWQGEFHNKRKDGTLFWERASISPVHDASGTITNFVAVKEDVTAQKTLEAQYLHAQKMEAVGRLAGGIAHDFNNMLSVIVGYTDSAMTELDPQDPIYADLEQVRAAAFRSAELTRQLLAFSRRQTILPVVLDLGAQVAGMEGMLRRIIGEDVKLEIRSQADVWPVFMDPSQIDQVLANLVVNARDAMPRGGRLIIETGNVELTDEYAATHAGCTPGCYVLLTVSDTGIGMDKDTLEHVFEPFFTTKGEGKGTGLGLATVFGIVKQNGGYINVYSEAGHGSTFRVYLPRHTGEVPEEVLVREHAESVRGTETVLLVEDEEMVRELARRILEQAGYRVIPAAGPGEALARCETNEEPIHLLLTDVVMPNMNGSELARRIAALRPGLKVLFMSGYTTETIAHSGVLDWGAGFIEKPFDPYKLLAKAREVLDAG